MINRQSLLQEIKEFMNSKNIFKIKMNYFYKVDRVLEEYFRFKDLLCQEVVYSRLSE